MAGRGRRRARLPAAAQRKAAGVTADDIRNQIYKVRENLRAIMHVVWQSGDEVAERWEPEIVRLNREIEALKMRLYAAISDEERAAGGN